MQDCEYANVRMVRTARYKLIKRDQIESLHTFRPEGG